jgi:hypothetical protein
MKDYENKYASFAPYEFDNGYATAKIRILDIIDKYQCGPYDDKAQDILYKLRKEIEEL